MILRRRSRPSYKQGFARSASESANPWAWDNVFRIFAPALGPTGDTLRDWSGAKDHGTLTLMDPATDWVIGANPRLPAYELDFGGGDDYVALSTMGDFGSTHLTGKTSWEFWVQNNVTTAGVIAGLFNDGGSTAFVIEMNRHPDNSILVGRIRVHLRGASGSSTQIIGGLGFDSGISDGIFHHFVVQADAAADLLEIWIDGISQTITYNAQTTPVPGDFGYPLTLCARNLRGVIDRHLECDIQLFTLRTDWLNANQIQQFYADPLAPFRRRRVMGPVSTDVDLTTPVSATKVSPSEFLSFITNLYKTPINIILNVSPTYKIITEILGTISPSFNKIPTEVLAGILLSSKPLVETIGTLAEFQKTPIDSLLDLAETSVKLPIESLLAISDINKLPIETINTLLDLNKIPVETLLDILDLSKMPVEMLQGISNTLSVPIEILQGINSLNKIPIEFAGATVITVQKTVPIEFIGTLLEIENVTVENLAPVSDLRRLPVEYLQGISTTNTKIPLISLLTILGLEKLPVGYILELIKANKTPIDSLLSLDQFDSLPIDALLALSQTDSMPVEFAGSATTAVEVTKLTPIEIIGFLSENRSMPVENRGILVITKKTAIEALLAVAPDNFSILVESLGGVGPLKLIPVESFSLSIATKIKQWVLANRGQMWILPKREFDWTL